MSLRLIPGRLWLGVTLACATLIPAAALNVGSIHAAHAVRKAPTAVEHPTRLALSAMPVDMRGGQTYDHAPPMATEHDQALLTRIPAGHPQGMFQRRPVSTPFSAAISTAAGARHAASFNVFANTANASPANNDPVDPSEASDGNVVVYATNEYISFSVDGGHTFASFNPASLYADSPDGGACCDQIIQFVPSINRFVWLDQYWAGSNGRNRYRLAVFSPTDVTSTGLTSWTYWDITAASFPALKRPFLDFPDLSVGHRYLYLSANNGCEYTISGLCTAGHVYTSVLARIGLGNLQNGLNLADNTLGEAWRYIQGPTYNWGRVAQNAGTRAYWAYNNTTSSMQVSYWDETSNVWIGQFTVNIFPWPSCPPAPAGCAPTYASTTPDGFGWVYTYAGQVLAGTRTGRGDVWFAWTAGKGTGKLAWLSQVHVELVDINIITMTLRAQRAIWNPSYAIAYPNLTTGQTGHLGMSMAFGGSGHWTNFAVADLTKSPNQGWNTTASTANCDCGRWGDYTAIRPGYGQSKDVVTGGFTAAGYGTVTNPTGAGGAVYDPHFISFIVS